MENNNAAVNEANIEQNVETEVETTTEETETKVWLPEWETKAETKWQSKAKKLLSQRNEARTELEDANSRIKALEERFQTEDSAQVAKTNANFEASYWEEALKQATEVLNQHPSLGLEQAYQLAGGTLQKNPTRFSTPWRTPVDLRREKSVTELSGDDLRAAAMEDIKSLWL